MRIHILGICGTFMGGVAALARQAGHAVSGSDENTYPPMSSQLEALGIDVIRGFSPQQFSDDIDQVVVGNIMTRGNPAVEYMLNCGLPYTSGPQWLAENVLPGRWVLAVAGTHGKTTTASMLAWILEFAGLAPGFLIGGVADNFGVTARLGEGRFFVVEADEYDTAFFDKRSKFVHYHPRTLVLNNLEFDHADIFADLSAIQRQVHHLVRTVPSEGRIVCRDDDANLKATLDMGCWTPVERFSATPSDAEWTGEAVPGGGFTLRVDGRCAGTVRWPLQGRHNRENGLAACAAAHHAGISPDLAVRALSEFGGVARRLQLRGEVAGIRVYDDFAHHPTAIAATLQGWRESGAGGRVIAIIEPRSNTMRRGVHADNLAESLSGADAVWFLHPDDLQWDPAAVLGSLGHRLHVVRCVDDMVERLANGGLEAGDAALVMSNGGFGGLHEKLLAALRRRHTVHGPEAV